MYKNEKEFLKNYDSSEFEKMSLTADIVVMSVANEDIDNYRKSDEKKFSLLLRKRKEFPFKGSWALPGSFLDIKESLEDTINRVLFRDAGLKNIYMEQLYTFSEVKRDPRMRIISTAYMTLIDKNDIKQDLESGASWFDITFEEDDKFITCWLDNSEEKISFKIKKVPNGNVVDKFDYEIEDCGGLAFDHSLIINMAILRMKNKVEYTDIIFNMMPEVFTLGELQQVYEAVLGKKLLAAAFRRTVKNKVEKTDQIKTGAGHRPSALFKYKG